MTSEDKKIKEMLVKATNLHNNTADREKEKLLRKKIISKLPKGVNESIITPNFVMMITVWCVVTIILFTMHRELYEGFKSILSTTCPNNMFQIENIYLNILFIIFVIFGIFETWSYTEE